MNRTAAALITATLTLTALAGCESAKQIHERNVARCATDKGVVTGPEREKKNGIWVDEYECERDGRELFEWNWNGK